jgi:hypothetical protein
VLSAATTVADGGYDLDAIVETLEEEANSDTIEDTNELLDYDV